MRIIKRRMKSNISFEKANIRHKDIVFQWLDESYVQEFWDNSLEHRQDILSFMNGRKEASVYFGGVFIYWIGYYNKEPYSFFLTSEVLFDQDCPDLWKNHMSKIGKTFTIDFCIGNKEFLGKGLAAPTLIAFMEFFKLNIDSQVGMFFIDPDENNPRAQHVYAKAGFDFVGDFTMEKGVFEGQKSRLMVKKMEDI